MSMQPHEKRKKEEKDVEKETEGGYSLQVEEEEEGTEVKHVLYSKKEEVWRQEEAERQMHSKYQINKEQVEM